MSHTCEAWLNLQTSPKVCNIVRVYSAAHPGLELLALGVVALTVGGGGGAHRLVTRRPQRLARRPQLLRSKQMGMLVAARLQGCVLGADLCKYSERIRVGTLPVM